MTIPHTTRLPRLTPCEARVLALCAEGLQTPQIAARLGISKRTADFHRRSVMLKHQRPGRRNSIWSVLAERGMLTPEEGE